MAVGGVRDGEVPRRLTRIPMGLIFHGLIAHAVGAITLHGSSCVHRGIENTCFHVSMHAITRARHSCATLQQLEVEFPPCSLPPHAVVLRTSLALSSGCLGRCSPARYHLQIGEYVGAYKQVQCLGSVTSIHLIVFIIPLSLRLADRQPPCHSRACKVTSSVRMRKATALGQSD